MSWKARPLGAENKIYSCDICGKGAPWRDRFFGAYVLGEPICDECERKVSLMLTDIEPDNEPLGRTSKIHERRRELLGWLKDDVWQRPMDLGAWNGSYHSNDLRYLVDRGFAEKKNRSAWVSRPAWLYRRTPTGKAYLTK